jgi:FMN phosphatase YigB (HAD superfamily)
MERGPGSADVKGIVFDLDGTLYRMRWFMRPILFAFLFPQSRRLPRFLKVRGRFAGIDLGSREALLDAVAAGLAEQENVLPGDCVRWMLDKFYPAFIATMRFQRSDRPRLVDTLRSLKSRGTRLAVLSDYHSVAERLEKLRIPLELFDTITSCEAAGALKPAARPFLEIAAAWNLAPSSILVVGDRDDTDGEAARRAGMQFLQVGDGKHLRPAGQARSWSEVREMLLGIRKG